MAIASLKLIGGTGGRLEDDEIALGEPDEAEARDLALHVEKDTKRYRVMMRRLYQLNRGNSVNTWLLAAIILLLILTNGPFYAMLVKLGVLH